MSTLKLDNKKIKRLMEEILTSGNNPPAPQPKQSDPFVNDQLTELGPYKNPKLTSTEEKVYFDISNHYRLTTLAIRDYGVALAVWINGILPILLEKHGIMKEEWDRICQVGDNQSDLSQNLDKSWLYFLDQSIHQRKLSPVILKFIAEGQRKVEKELGKRKAM